MTEIQRSLFDLQDKEYKEFTASLNPTVQHDNVIGVRVPILRQFAKDFYREYPEKAIAFMHELPHKYLEENHLHAFILEQNKDLDEVFDHLDEFLPYVDNWATCDSLKPKVFKNKKNKDPVLEKCLKYIKANDVYTIRFGIEQLMNLFLDDNFDVKQAEAITKVKNDDYYVKMMIAWYFATALAKKWDDIIPFIENKTLPDWTHNKAIQKSIESYRITAEQKEYLRTLKVKHRPG